MRTSAVALISGLAAVASATTSTWGYTTSTSSSSSSSSYDPTWSGAWTSSSTTTKAAVSTSSSYDPSWSAWTSTSTSTSTSYDPTWSAWTSTSTSYDPTWSAWTSTSTSYDPTWSAWGSSYTTPVAATTPCPAWTSGTAPPAYYTNLPASIKSALPSWTGAPPSDYCYYTSWMQSFSSCTAPAVVSPTTFASTGSYFPTWSAWSSTLKKTQAHFSQLQRQLAPLPPMEHGLPLLGRCSNPLHPIPY
jgi:hypothetical protein